MTTRIHIEDQNFRTAICEAAALPGVTGGDYHAHLEEAFTACLMLIRRQHPEATLEWVGSDMGGPLWRVNTNKDELAEARRKKGTFHD